MFRQFLFHIEMMMMMMMIIRFGWKFSTNLNTTNKQTNEFEIFFHYVCACVCVSCVQLLTKRLNEWMNEKILSSSNKWLCFEFFFLHFILSFSHSLSTKCKCWTTMQKKRIFFILFMKKHFWWTQWWWWWWWEMKRKWSSILVLVVVGHWYLVYMPVDKKKVFYFHFFSEYSVQFFGRTENENYRPGCIWIFFLAALKDIYIRNIFDSHCNKKNTERFFFVHLFIRCAVARILCIFTFLGIWKFFSFEKRFKF